MPWDVSRVCVATCAVCHMITQRIFWCQKCLPWTGNFYLRWIKIYGKVEEPKAYPKQAVLFLRICGFAHSWTQLFTERGNPTSNHSVSYNWVRVWYIKISRFNIILYLNNDIKHGRRGLYFEWPELQRVWHDNKCPCFWKHWRGILFYNLETWLCKLLAADKSVK